MQLSPNVRINGLKPEILLGIQITESVFGARDIPLVIQSIVDGDHDGGPFHTSSHYAGESFDASLPLATPDVADAIVAELTAALGNQFFLSVNAAKSHVHISYIPTR